MITNTKITVKDLKWVDENAKEIKKGIPSILSIEDKYLPSRIKLTKKRNDITKKSIESIESYLYDRFGCFPIAMTIECEFEIEE